ADLLVVGVLEPEVAPGPNPFPPERDPAVAAALPDPVTALGEGVDDDLDVGGDRVRGDTRLLEAPHRIVPVPRGEHQVAHGLEVPRRPPLIDLAHDLDRIPPHGPGLTS